MKRILLAAISIFPLLSFGQSMKISPKQIKSGLNGMVIITRNDTNKLDSLKWTDVSGKPTDLERTSNKVTNLNSPDNITYPTTQAVINALDLANDLRYKAQIPSGADLNNYTEEGNYSCVNGNYSSIINCPNIGTVTDFNLIVIRGVFTPSYTTQIVFPTNFSNANDVAGIWIRSKIFNGTGWTDWHHIATQDWVNSQGYLTVETEPAYNTDKDNLLRLDLYSNSGVYNAVNDVASANDITNTGIVRMANTNSDVPSFFSSVGGFIQTLVYRQVHSYGAQIGIKMDMPTARIAIRNFFPVSGTKTFSPWKELLGTGDNISLFNNDAGYITSSSIPAAQVLSLSGQNLSLSGGGGTVTLPTSGGNNIGNSNLEITDPYRYLTLSDTNTLIIGDTSNNGYYGNLKVGKNAIPTNVMDAAGGLYLSSGGDLPASYLALDGSPGILRMKATDQTDIFSDDARLHIGEEGDAPFPAVFSGTYTPYFIYTQNEGYISLSSNRSYFKTVSGLDIVNTGGSGIRLLDSSAGITIHTNSDIDISADGNATFNPAFSFSMTSGGPIAFTSTSAPFQVTTPAPIQLTSQNSPIEIYAGSGSPIQLSTDAGSNGVNIFTHDVTGFQNYEMPNESGTLLLDADTSTLVATKHDIPTVSDATLTLSTSIYGTTSSQTWTANHATDKTWSIIIPQISIIPEFNSSTGFLKVNNSTLAGPINDSVQLLSKINDKGYLQPTTGTGVNTGGGFAATAQTEAFNSTYIDLSDGTYTLYIVAGGNPSGGDIKLVDPNEIPDRIIRIVNTSGATGTFINAPIVGLTSSSVTTINSGKYIVIQSVINPSSGGRMWAQVGGNY